MKIIGEQRTEEFAARYPAIRTALRRWMEVVTAATWNNPADTRKTFRSADVVGQQTVFNIGGNKCRLIALIHYPSSRVLIQHVLTHAEYDKGAWKA